MDETDINSAQFVTDRKLLAFSAKTPRVIGASNFVYGRTNFR